MRTRSAALGLMLPAALLVGCADDEPTTSGRSTSPSPSASPTTATVPVASSPPAASTDPATGVVPIDTGGTQVLGLASADGAVWAVSYDTSTLSRIDPASNTVVATVDVPGGASVAALPSGLWVAAYGDPGHLYRIDTESNVVAVTADLGDLCCDLTEGGGLVWVLDRGGTLVGVDPGSGSVTSQFPVELDLDAHNNVVFAGGHVWVSSDTTKLFRFDPATGEQHAFDVGGGVPFLAKDGLLWGATPTELWAVDPSTGGVADRVAVPDSMEVMALSIQAGTAWIGMRHPGYVGAVVELDLEAGEVRREVPVEIPARVELAFGSVWVTDSGGSTVLRILP